MIIFFLRIIDCAISAMKFLCLQKHKYFLAALLASIQSLFYLVVIIQLVRTDNNVGFIFLFCLATFLGNYIPLKIMQKREKQFVYVFDVVPDTNEKGKEFADSVREQNIPILTYKGFNKKLEPVLSCKIFSQNKAESKLIEQMIPAEFHYHVLETKSAILTDSCF